VPKFSESHPLPFKAIHILMIVAFMWLYAWALGWFVPKPTYEDYNIKYTRISRIIIWGLWSFVFKSMRKVSMNILHLHIFSVYSVELELHVRKCLNLTPMLGFTRLDLSSLEALKVFRVVVIWIELLSLAWPALGLGSCYVTAFTPVSPCHCLSLWLLFPVSVENRDLGW
jgi:hypothetical protein